MKTILLLLISAGLKAQCISDVAPYPVAIFNECFEAPLEATTPFTPTCPTWHLGGQYVYEFFSDGVNPVSIIVESDLYFTFNEGTTILAHAFITDGCNGSTLWASSTSCVDSPLVSVVYTNFPALNWVLDIQLPEGLFYFHIGNLGIESVQPQIEGCFDVMIGTMGMLNLSVPYRVKVGTPYNPFGRFDVLGRRY